MTNDMNEELIEQKNNEIIPLPMSRELEDLLNFINNSLSKELPTLTIDLDYFILGIFTQRKSYIYKRLDNCLVSSAIDAIYSAFYKTVSSKALTAIKSNRKIGLDNNFVNILMKAEEEAKNMESSNVTTEHVFLSILSDSD